MKKFTFLLAVLLTAMTAMAQEKVAILETVDKSGNVPYGIKLLLRSSLTTAISNTPGYEGYDRVDMASIASEQEFQRTGNVSDNQIKEIGVASGAKYVLVAEVAKYDDVRIIITAKLLDVETFGVKSSSVQITGTSADEMKRSCEQLAKELLRIKREQQMLPNQPVEKKKKDPKVKYTRPTWFGISVEGGGDKYAHYYVYDYDNGYGSHNSYNLYGGGITADLSFPIFNWLSMGPYGGGYIMGANGHYGFKGGAMMKITFRNNFGFLFGGGAAVSQLNNNDWSPRFELRFGIKFSSPFYLTISGILEDYNWHSDYWGNGIRIGLGYSIGGKLKQVTPAQ